VKTDESKLQHGLTICPEGLDSPFLSLGWHVFTSHID